MSDARVRAAVEQMEAWLNEPAWEPDPDALARWDSEFRSALAVAEKGESWLALAERAHAAGRRLEAKSEEMSEVLARIKGELEAQERGSRALRGYGASSR